MGFWSNLFNLKGLKEEEGLVKGELNARKKTRYEQIEAEIEEDKNNFEL